MYDLLLVKQTAVSFLPERTPSTDGDELDGEPNVTEKVVEFLVVEGLKRIHVLREVNTTDFGSLWIQLLHPKHHDHHVFCRRFCETAMWKARWDKRRGFVC
jgi:hypothetical protein